MSQSVPAVKAAAAQSGLPEADPVARTMALLASALFVEPRSVKYVARYLVMHYTDPTKGSLRQMDELADAIMRAPFSMRLYGTRGLAEATSNTPCFVMTLELWHAVPVALPLEYGFNEELVGLLTAVREMTHERDRTLFYGHARRSELEGEYILENFTLGASRKLAEQAWPSLLLVLCYYYYCDMLATAVARARCTRSFAMDALRASTRQLDVAIANPSMILHLRRNAVLACPGVTEETLLGELTQLRAILSDTEIGRVTVRLLEYAGALAAQCVVTSA